MAAATHLPTGPDTVCAAFEVAAEQHADRSFLGVPAAAGDLSDAAIERLADAYRAAGVEDVFFGDIAQDIRERLNSNPKALERELGSQ
jgi:hypothetical protein